MRKTWTAYLPDVFGRRRISELECRLEEAQGEIEELCAEAGVVSADFEKDCWRAMRRLLERCKFDWRDVGGDGVTANEAEEFIRGFIDELDERFTPVLRDVATERRRQIVVEGWTPEHDDNYVDNELPRAAACYAARVTAYWPWEMEFWKPSHDHYLNLKRASALIVADMERIKRSAETEAKP